MIDLDAIKKSFPEIEDLVSLKKPSGQKDVFKGRIDNHTVALKLFKRADAGIAQRIEREREATKRLAAVTELQSDYVPQVYDHGERTINKHIVFYLVEQFIEGTPYDEILRNHPVQQVVDVLRLADVLLCACVDFEKASIVHRDIKPSNIMFDCTGKIWVIDFGIVRFLDSTPLTPMNNQFGSFTPGYAPPEQMRNRQNYINSLTDLFAVGVVLYESLNGCNPYTDGKHSQLEIINHVESQDLPRLTIQGDIDGALSEFIFSLTNRFRSRRPQTAQEAFTWFSALRAQLPN